MKKNLHLLFLLLTGIAFLLLVAYDFYPFEFIGQGYLIGAVFLFWFASVGTQNFSDEKTPEKSRKLARNVFIGTTLLMGYIAVLSMIFGESTAGIDIYNPVVWLIYAFTLYSFYKNYVKKKKAKA